MKKVELLVPAGNKEMLHAAIHNGADAVYLSGKLYGARAFANNFTLEELIEAIKYAHLYDVKVYVTINTLIKEDEVEDLLNYVRVLHQNNVDAIIVQDMGMIDLFHKKFPNLEIHASTQSHIHNNNGINLLKSLGVKRVILARELTLNEIKELDKDIEKEVFIHGALCISYSGNCLLSSEVLNRSGNRGKCAGLCRLPYKLTENGNNIKTEGDYLLSTKDLCTLENISEIIESNVASLKIEGRMKSKEYVAYTTRLYRKYIDNYYKGIKEKPTKEEIENLKVIYNRDFTSGHINNQTDSGLMNIKTPNHIGIPLGKILEVGPKLKIKLNRDLYQGDAIRFNESNKGMYVNFLYNEKGKLINKGEKNTIIYIDNKEKINTLDSINLTIDEQLNKIINNQEEKKIPITFKVTAKQNSLFELTIKDNKHTLTITDNIIEPAKNRATTKEEILSKLEKLGTTPFILKEITQNIDDNIFIPMSKLNGLRRNLINQLIQFREGIPQTIVEKEYFFHNNTIPKIDIKKSYLINKEEHYELIKNESCDIYVDNPNLYNKLKDNKNIYLRLDRVNNNKKYNNQNLLITDISNIFQTKENNVHSDIYLNVTNSYTVKVLEELGVNKITLSSELNIEEILHICDTFEKRYQHKPNLQVFIYGKIELMILKHCIPKMHVNKDKNCSLCKNSNKYELIDRNNKKYAILMNKKINKVLNYKITNRLEELHNYNISKLISLIDIEDVPAIIREIKEVN